MGKRDLPLDEGAYTIDDFVETRDLMHDAQKWGRAGSNAKDSRKRMLQRIAERNGHADFSNDCGSWV